MIILSKNKKVIQIFQLLLEHHEVDYCICDSGKDGWKCLNCRVEGIIKNIDYDDNEEVLVEFSEEFINN